MMAFCWSYRGRIWLDPDQQPMTLEELWEFALSTRQQRPKKEWKFAFEIQVRTMYIVLWNDAGVLLKRTTNVLCKELVNFEIYDLVNFEIYDLVNFELYNLVNFEIYELVDFEIYELSLLISKYTRKFTRIADPWLCYACYSIILPSVVPTRAHMPTLAPTGLPNCVPSETPSNITMYAIYWIKATFWYKVKQLFMYFLKSNFLSHLSNLKC